MTFKLLVPAIYSCLFGGLAGYYFLRTVLNIWDSERMWLHHRFRIVGLSAIISLPLPWLIGPALSIGLTFLLLNIFYFWQCCNSYFKPPYEKPSKCWPMD